MEKGFEIPSFHRVWHTLDHAKGYGSSPSSHKKTAQCAVFFVIRPKPIRKRWYTGTGSNRRPTGCKPVALPLSYPCMGWGSRV